MKTLTTVLVLLTIATMSQAQNNLFYYAFDEQVELTPVANEYTVEFLGSDDQAYLNANSLTNERIRTKVYQVSASLSAVSSASQGTFKFNPVYELSDGTRVNMLNRVVLRWKDGVGQSTISTITAQYGLSLVKTTRLYELYEVNSPLSTSKLVYQTGQVIYCTPEFIAPVQKTAHIPNDEYFGQQFHLHNTGQQCNDGHFGTADADIDAPEAWDITFGDPSIIVAVVDEGVSASHPDLPNSRQLRLPGSNFAAPYDASDPDDPSPTLGVIPAENHGNACAGIVAAEIDNNEGVVGVAPGCTVMPVKIRYGGLLSWQDFADAITFAADNGAHVISCSWGASGFVVEPSVNTAIEDAITQGSLVVFAAGNDADHSVNDIGFVTFPGNQSQIPLLLTVAASDRNDVQANYSPTSYHLDIAAPSHTAYFCQIPSEGFNVWTIDIPGLDGYNQHNGSSGSTCDDPPNGNLSEQLPGTGINHLSYTGRMGGTSSAAPQISAIAALMLSVNPCLSVQELHDILLSTADEVGGYNYNWMPGQSLQLGHGRANAFDAVLAAQALYNPTVDLYIKDVPYDFGSEPNGLGQFTWISPDIWVREFQDGQTQHQDGIEWTSGVPVYAYVRVRNKGCVPTNGVDEELKLYWAKAATALTWPDYWDGSITIPQLMGAPIGTQTIPPLAPGEEVLIPFEWYRPNPDDYNGINSQPWHFCLLARIEATTDPMFNELPSGMWNLGFNVEQNNNIASKNISIVNIVPGIAGGGWPDDATVGANISVGNATDETGSYCLELANPDQYSGKAITDEAEVRVTFDDLTWSIWQQGGQQGENIDVYNEERKQLLITGSPATINNLRFEPHQRGVIDVSFNFLAKELSGKPEFIYDVVQRDVNCDVILGGERYIIRIPPRDGFEADAGDDEEVDKNTQVQLSAEDIQENAIYNWYDPSGELVYTGKDLTVTADVTRKYKLEIIAEADGLKDYDEVEVRVKSASLTNISPNPAEDLITVSYDPQQVTSAYLMVNMPFTGNTNNYILDLNNTAIQIDVSAYSPGVYGVILVADGQMVDELGLVVN